jgi:hypothetical protein
MRFHRIHARLHAIALLVALLGSLGLPWLGASHRFNDDPHWAVDLAFDHPDGPHVGEAHPGDDTHCELCHWLRTMRTAHGQVAVAFAFTAQAVVLPGPVSPRTRAAQARRAHSRAPPAVAL